MLGICLFVVERPVGWVNTIPGVIDAIVDVKIGIFRVE